MLPKWKKPKRVNILGIRINFIDRPLDFDSGVFFALSALAWFAHAAHSLRVCMHLLLRNSLVIEEKLQESAAGYKMYKILASPAGSLSKRRQTCKIHDKDKRQNLSH